MTITITRPVIEDWSVKETDKYIRTKEQELALRVAESLNESNWCQGYFYLISKDGSPTRTCAVGKAYELDEELTPSLDAKFIRWYGTPISYINDRRGLVAIKDALTRFGNAELST